MAEIRNASWIVEKVLEAFNSHEGADLGDGVRLFAAKRCNISVSVQDDTVRLTFDPPADVRVKRYYGMVNLRGTLDGLTLTREELRLVLSRLPDKTFKIVP